MCVIHKSTTQTRLKMFHKVLKCVCVVCSLCSLNFLVVPRGCFEMFWPAPGVRRAETCSRRPSWRRYSSSTTRGARANVCERGQEPSVLEWTPRGSIPQCCGARVWRGVAMCSSKQPLHLHLSRGGTTHPFSELPLVQGECVALDLLDQIASSLRVADSPVLHGTEDCMQSAVFNCSAGHCCLSQYSSHRPRHHTKTAYDFCP